MSASNRFCSKCGAQLPAGAAFCPVCGTATQAATPPPSATSRAASPGAGRSEKQEKYEKHEKGEKNEKGRGGDVVWAVTGGAILIWLGVVFFLEQNGYASSDWWAFLVMGIGVIVILQGLLWYAMNGVPFAGSFIGGAIIVLIGLAFVQGISADIWPLFLILVGVAVILSAMVGRRRRPTP